MEKTVRTAIGAKLQTAQKLNRPYLFEPNSVMNKLLGVLPDDLPSKTPAVGYFAIGIGGLSVRFVGERRRAEFFPMPHDPRHTGLYEQIPFVARPVADDLSTSERLKFRLRKLMNISGETYALYYGRTLDLTTTDVQLEYRVIKDGVISSHVWSPSPDDQRPTPWTINDGQYLSTGDDYVASTAKSVVKFTPWDIAELINVGRVMYNSEDAITVSEIAIISGVDEQTTGDFNGVHLPYTEVIGAQITDFVSVNIPTNYMQAGAAVNLDIGSTEPLLELKVSRAP